MKQLPNPGTYQARRNKPIVVREEKSGALMAYISYILLDGSGFTGIHAQCIGTKDGTIQERSVKTLREIFPAWDGLDPFGLELIEVLNDQDSPAEFELGDCFHEEYQKKQDDGSTITAVSFKAQWLNPLGGGAPSKEAMSPEDKKKTLTKWAGKFKALAGGSGVKKASAPAASPSAGAPKGSAKPSAPAAAPVRPAAPGRKSTGASARTSTQQEVWDGLCKKHEGEKTEDELGDMYWAAIDEVAPGSGGELTLSQWGQVADKLEV